MHPSGQRGHGGWVGQGTRCVGNGVGQEGHGGRVGQGTHRVGNGVGQGGHNLGNGVGQGRHGVGNWEVKEYIVMEWGRSGRTSFRKWGRSRNT